MALGGTFSAAYPRQSPGGWQLIGRTTAVLWDLERESPALVRPGDRVRYVAVREAIALAPAPHAAREFTGPALVVDSPGLQSLVQDLGRPGLGDLGVSAAGAVDQQSTRQANRLVGNEPGAAVVETVLGELTVRTIGDQVLAVAGAVVPMEIRDASGRRPAAPQCARPSPSWTAKRSAWESRPSGPAVTLPSAAGSMLIRCSAAAQATRCPESVPHHCRPGPACRWEERRCSRWLALPRNPRSG
ncbi:uncharacterized protein YbgJ [Arthrobacter sp. Hiyo8]|nr:uncharacterized protein YbgJ [Arthrobacter sp. Hiyo8]